MKREDTQVFNRTLTKLNNKLCKGTVNPYWGVAAVMISGKDILFRIFSSAERLSYHAIAALTDDLWASIDVEPKHNSCILELEVNGLTIKFAAFNYPKEEFAKVIESLR